MSYILEALNKSEQERRARQTPDLSTIHHTAPPVKRGQRWGIIFLVVIVLINLGALVYWLGLPGTHDLPVAAEPGLTIPRPGEEASVTEVYTAAPETITAQPQTRPEPSLITPTQVSRAIVNPVRITELPLDVQRQIPDLIFSSHLYSDAADFRMVNINGKMIREGDMVARDLKLEEITEEGVILTYLHYHFEVSVLQDWKFN